VANGTHQIEYLIQEANEEVAAKGMQADSTFLLLAAIGYLAHEIKRPRGWLSGKKGVAGGSVGGAGVGVVILETIRNLFS